MKLKKLFSSVCSVLTALALLIATEAYIPVRASAADNQLNVKIYMCSTLCVNFSSISDEVTLGTYGTPTSYTDRLPAITGYAYGYYMNSGAYINFMDFTSANIRHSPARLCADQFSSEAALLEVIKYGCPCNGDGIIADINCFNGTLHHNNVKSFKNDIQNHDAETECALYLTASPICVNNSSTHIIADGAANRTDMKIISRDFDYAYEHQEGETNPYAYARMTLVHELGHIYHVEDHYDLADSSNYNPDCIWGDNRYDYDIASICSTCSTCHNTIINNRNNYQHT